MGKGKSEENEDTRRRRKWQINLKHLLNIEEESLQKYVKRLIILNKYFRIKLLHWIWKKNKIIIICYDVLIYWNTEINRKLSLFKFHRRDRQGWRDKNTGEDVDKDAGELD